MFEPANNLILYVRFCYLYYLLYTSYMVLSCVLQVYGKLAEYDGYERLEWKHSYARVYTPQGRYEPQGVFMSFEHYNVEVRDRVKCISGMEGKHVAGGGYSI